MKAEAKGIRVTLEGEGVKRRPRTRAGRSIACSSRSAAGRTRRFRARPHTACRSNERGFIVVDEQRRTDEPSIFAIGDVVGEPMLAHKASHEGRVAVEVIAGENVAFAPRAIPAVVFTDPEIAWAADRGAGAQKDGRKVTIAKFPWGASGRAITLDRTDGLTKLDPRSGDRARPRRRHRRPRRRRTDRRRRARHRDGRERDRPQADDPSASDALGDGDGVGRGVLRPGDARLPPKKRLSRRQTGG